jgi:MFS family permease
MTAIGMKTQYGTERSYRRRGAGVCDETPTVRAMSAARRRALVGLGIGLALADSSVVTLALPDILRRFDVEIPQVAWVLTSYNLGLAAAAVPAAYLARRRPRAAFAAGTLVFAAASLACGLAPSFGVLVGARCVQAVGGALLVCAALDLLTAIEGSDARSVRTWAAAGILGAALGPAAGGILTETLGWESIFLVQAPLALVTLAALVALHPRPVPGPAGRPNVPANVALLLLSGALTAALFLLVLLLVDGWRINPAIAGVIVTVLPAAAIVTGRIADRVGSPLTRAASGAVLIAGGLAALGVLPGSSWLWTLVPQVLVGAGLGLSLSALTERALQGRSPQAVHGGWTIAARHAGVVVGLVLLTPVFTSALDTNEDRALRAGAAAVIDSSILPLEKLGLAQDVLALVRSADREVPDVREAFADRPDDDAYRELESTLVSELDRAVTAAFARPFLLAALLALAALVPIAFSRGRVSV